MVEISKFDGAGIVDAVDAIGGDTGAAIKSATVVVMETGAALISTATVNGTMCG